MINHFNQVSAFAPATSANVAVGFDILGFAVADLGDEVTLRKSRTAGLKIVSIIGAESLPYDVTMNTATVALKMMLEHLKLEQGFEISIKKNIPLSSGLGGSAACSVAALIALNRFLKRALPLEQLVDFALAGEQAACGSRHGDNVIPCLFGGMTLIQSLSPVRVVSLPLIPLSIVLIHPHLYLETRESRSVLPQQIDLVDYVKQSAHLASFISALYEKNYDRLQSACLDEVIEPMRAHLIPHFYAVKDAAFRAGALACSISGSGPTLFAMAKTPELAHIIAEHMINEFKIQGIQVDAIVTTISSQGAKVIDEQ